MKRVLLLISFVALVLASVASASHDTGACCPAGAAGQAQAQHEMHGKDPGCCAKMADGKACCTPDADRKKSGCPDGTCACCAEGTCEMKKQNANGEHKAGCCQKEAADEAKAACCAKKTGAEGKGGCCTKHAPQGARS